MGQALNEAKSSMKLKGLPGVMVNGILKKIKRIFSVIPTVKMRIRMILSVYLVKNLQTFAKLSIVGISNKFTTIQPSLRMLIIPTSKYRSFLSLTNQASKNNLCNEFRNN